MIASELEVLLGVAPPPEPEPAPQPVMPHRTKPRRNRWGDLEVRVRGSNSGNVTWAVNSTCRACGAVWTWWRHSHAIVPTHGYSKCAQCAASEHNARMRFAARVMSGAVRGQHDH